MTYEVQHYTLCDGWVNTWTVEKIGGSVPWTFDSREEALFELNEFLREKAEEVALGFCEPECGYNKSEFRVVKVKDDQL